MRYLIVLDGSEPGDGFDVTVPDLPGCTSAGDTLSDALDNAAEAIAGHVETMLAEGYAVPTPSFTAPTDLPPDHMVAVVDTALDRPSESHKAVRLSVTIPEAALGMIDQAAKRAGTSRSGFLTRAALALIERQARA